MQSSIDPTMLSLLTEDEKTKLDQRENANAEFKQNAAGGDYYISLNSSGNGFVVSVKQQNNDISNFEYIIISGSLNYKDEPILTSINEHAKQQATRIDYYDQNAKLLLQAINDKNIPLIEQLASTVPPDHPARIFTFKIIPLSSALSSGTPEIIEALLKHSDVDINKFNPLVIALKNDNFSVAEYLINNKLLTSASLNDQALFEALNKGRWDIVKLLVAAGADPSQINFNEQNFPLAYKELQTHPEYTLLSHFFTPVPISQEWLLQRMKALDYKAASPGLCFAITAIGRAALLTENDDPTIFQNFNNRFRYLASLTEAELKSELQKVQAKYIKDIAQIKNKLYEEYNIDNENQLHPMARKKFIESYQKAIEDYRNSMSEEIKMILTVPEFFDALEVWQEPHLYPDILLNEIKLDTQDSQKALSALLVTPQSLEKLGGEVKVDSFTGVYDHTDLQVYFTTLRDTFRREPKFNEPVMIEFNSWGHAISISYNPKLDRFIFLDANSLPAKIVTSESELAKLVQASFYTEKSILTSQIYIARDPYKTKDEAKIQEHQAFFREKLASWKSLPPFKGIQEITDEKVKYRDNFGNSWLNQAAKYGDTNSLRDILNSKDVEINHIPTNTRYGGSPLEVAIANNHKEAISLLVASADLDPNVGEILPLIRAMSRNDQSLVEAILLHQRTNPNLLSTFSSMEYSPLTFAIRYNRLEILSQLLADERIDPNLLSTNQQTPLLYAVSSKNVAAVELLLLHPQINPNLNTPSDSKTPLMQAVLLGDINVIRAILAHPATNPNLIDNQGNSALYYAANNKEVMKLLLTDPKIDTSSAIYQQKMDEFNREQRQQEKSLYVSAVPVKTSTHQIMGRLQLSQHRENTKSTSRKEDYHANTKKNPIEVPTPSKHVVISKVTKSFLTKLHLTKDKAVLMDLPKIKPRRRS